MFSIHTASTGPSNRYHFLSEVVLELPHRIMDDKMPSVLKCGRVQIGSETKISGIIGGLQEGKELEGGRVPLGKGVRTGEKQG